MIIEYRLYMYLTVYRCSLQFCIGVFLFLYAKPWAIVDFASFPTPLPDMSISAGPLPSLGA